MMKKYAKITLAMATSMIAMLVMAISLTLSVAPAHAALSRINPECLSVEAIRAAHKDSAGQGALVNDAFAYLLPCNITVSTGQSVTLDLMINTGSHTAIAQQSYLTFTNSLLQVVNPNTGCGNPVTTVQPDTSVLDLVFQNQVDNATGRIAYASGTFGAGSTGTFRVARVTFCSTGNGVATLNWEFTPPRSSGITDENSERIENQALYQNCTIVNPVPATATSTSQPTNTSTHTATATAIPTNTTQPTSAATNTPQPTGTATRTATNTVIATNTASSTPSNTATRSATSTNTATGTATGTNTTLPSVTVTSVASGTATSTHTAISTETVTSQPTDTNTVTPSQTATVGASSTRTAAAAASSTATNVPTNTSTSTIIPSATHTSVTTATLSPTSAASATSSLVSTGTSTRTSIFTSTVEATATQIASATASPTSTVTVCAIEFSDVPPGSTFYSYIKCLACRGIVTGYADGTFRPDNPVTRGQLSKIVAGAAGFNEPVTGQRFSDVPPGSIFYEYIERLASRGIIGGYSDGTFRPNANSTRGQISKIVSNAAGYNEAVSGQRFSDVPPGSTFYEYIERLASRGIIGGYNDGTFRPDTNATRGQVSKIVTNTFFPNCTP